MSNGVALEDVKDVEDYAAWMARRTFRNGNVTVAELEEAVNEGVVLIYELHGIWEPARCERFSAFLLIYLPRKLISWYRVNLRQSGRGRWSGSAGEYRYNGTVSLDADSPYQDGSGSGHNEFEAPRINGNRGDSALIVYGPGD